MAYNSDADYANSPVYRAIATEVSLLSINEQESRSSIRKLSLAKDGIHIRSPMRAFLAFQLRDGLSWITGVRVIMLPLGLFAEALRMLGEPIERRYQAYKENANQAYSRGVKKSTEFGWWLAIFGMGILNGLIVQPLFFLANTILHLRIAIEGIVQAFSCLFSDREKSKRGARVFLAGTACLLVDAIAASAVYFLSVFFPIATPYLTGLSTSIQAGIGSWIAASVVGNVGIGMVTTASNRVAHRTMNSVSTTLGLIRKLDQNNKESQMLVNNVVDNSQQLVSTTSQNSTPKREGGNSPAASNDDYRSGAVRYDYPPESSPTAVSFKPTKYMTEGHIEVSESVPSVRRP